MGLFDRLQHGWNAFINNRDPTVQYRYYGSSHARRPDRVRLSRGNERTTMTAIISRIAMDATSIEIKHVKTDENGRYLSDIDSGLNNVLNIEANIDQSGRAFRQDIFMSLMDEGGIAVVPVDTEINPTVSDSFDIETARVGKIIEWYPQHVKVHLYNDQTGEFEDVVVPKRTTVILENPFYAVMNEPNSTMQRLNRKLALLDAVDEQSSSGKLDLIIQLPYVVKTPAKKQMAEERRADIERQLSGSQYGIAYTDGTEHITQLNRPIENNLMKQVEYLTGVAHSQLGITQSILDGTADEKTMLNYNTRTVEPMVAALVDELKRKFVSKSARSKGESVMYFRSPFRLVPVSEIAEIADKFTRNEIATSNEIRQEIGWKPSKDPKADQLINSNLNHPEGSQPPVSDTTENVKKEDEVQNG